MCYNFHERQRERDRENRFLCYLFIMQKGTRETQSNGFSSLGGRARISHSKSFCILKVTNHVHVSGKYIF